MRWVPWILVACVGCATKSPPVTSTSTIAPIAPTRVELAGLHNVYRVTPHVYSGSSPDDDSGFRSLQTLGIRTILSVDGSTPELAAAKRFGLRYVHLPIGYDGVSESRALNLAKAMRDLPGPIYIHCHHGKHRGPAATMAALRCLNDHCSADHAKEFLQTAGTDPRYVGLFAAVSRSPSKVDSSPTEFPELTPVADLTRIMVQIDDVWSRLKTKPTDADWVLLREHYRETKRLASTLPEGFRELLTQAESAAERADAKRSATLCTHCHSQYRDKPR
jgi:protein tyrosine phosphatase (PTP) superfamily phosphohydrolase (DUF442 family)